jgi:uncharacterized protein (TIGR00369 family)
MEAVGKPLDFNQTLGFKREAWRDGEGRISLDLQPLHLNAAGVVHGGVLVTLLDVTTAMTGLFCSKKGNRRHAVTVSLTTNFIGQAKGGKIIATGRRTASGRKLYFADAEVRSESGELLATASAVHRYRSGSENPEGVPKKV